MMVIKLFRIPKQVNVVVKGDVWLRHTAKPRDDSRPLPSPSNVPQKHKN